MSRDVAKLLKSSLKMAQGDAQIREATVALLRHSLRLGHRRLSLQRLEAAVGCGAELTEDDLYRCAELVLRANDVLAHARLASMSRQLAVPAAGHRQVSCQ